MASKEWFSLQSELPGILDDEEELSATGSSCENHKRRKTSGIQLHKDNHILDSIRRLLPLGTSLFPGTISKDYKNNPRTGKQLEVWVHKSKRLSVDRFSDLRQSLDEGLVDHLSSIVPARMDFPSLWFYCAGTLTGKCLVISAQRSIWD
jgi:hypothetical protein